MTKSVDRASLEATVRLDRAISDNITMLGNQSIAEEFAKAVKS
jgi:hypothetical protein